MQFGKDTLDTGRLNACNIHYSACQIQGVYTQDLFFHVSHGYKVILSGYQIPYSEFRSYRIP